MTLNTSTPQTMQDKTNLNEDLTDWIIPSLPGSDTYRHQYEWTEDQSEELPWVSDKNWKPSF